VIAGNSVRRHKRATRDVRSRLHKRTTRVARLPQIAHVKPISELQLARNVHQRERNGLRRAHKANRREHNERPHSRSSRRNHTHREVRKIKAVKAEGRNVDHQTVAAEAAIARSVSDYSSSGSPSRIASLVSSQATKATLPAAIRARMTPANGRIVRMLK